jgi:hypothetical protein
MTARLECPKIKRLNQRQASHQAKFAKSNTSAQGNMQRAAKKSRIEPPGYASGRTRSERPKADRKVRRIVTGAGQQKTSTAKMQPYSAKASLARNRASGRKGTLISRETRAKRAMQSPADGSGWAVDREARY